MLYLPSSGLGFGVVCGSKEIWNYHAMMCHNVCNKYNQKQGENWIYQITWQTKATAKWSLFLILDPIIMTSRQSSFRISLTIKVNGQQNLIFVLALQRNTNQVFSLNNLVKKKD